MRCAGDRTIAQSVCGMLASKKKKDSELRTNLKRSSGTNQNRGLIKRRCLSLQFPLARRSQSIPLQLPSPTHSVLVCSRLFHFLSSLCALFDCFHSRLSLCSLVVSRRPSAASSHNDNKFENDVLPLCSNAPRGLKHQCTTRRSSILQRAIIQHHNLPKRHSGSKLHCRVSTSATARPGIELQCSRAHHNGDTNTTRND